MTPSKGKGEAATAPDEKPSNESEVKQDTGSPAAEGDWQGEFKKDNPEFPDEAPEAGFESFTTTGVLLHLETAYQGKYQGEDRFEVIDVDQAQEVTESAGSAKLYPAEFLASMIQASPLRGLYADEGLLQNGDVVQITVTVLSRETPAEPEETGDEG